ncbi:MAG: glycosyltransferase family 1 protein [Planctomycetota bacterium]
MRVALVTETYPPEVNGVALTLQRMVRGLAVRGHLVEVVRPHQGKQDRSIRSRKDRTFDDHGVTEHIVPGMPMPMYDGLHIGLPARNRLVRRWKFQRPDIVHIATEGLLGFTALWAAYRLGLPVASSFHTNFHQYAKHYRIPGIEPVATQYLRWFHNRCGVTLTPSHTMVKRLAGHGFERVAWWPRGVDNQEFSPHYRSEELRQSWGVTPDDPVAIYVGRVAAEKNIPLTIAACDAARKKTPGLKLVIVGDGPMREQLAADRPDIVFAGMRHGDDLSAHFASADMFVFASETETFGNVVCEAMASRLAIVAYNYAAPMMHIAHDRAGHLVPLGDADAFTQATTDLAADPARIARLRQGAVDDISLHAWDRVVEAFEQTLQAVIDGTVPPTAEISVRNGHVPAAV